MINYGSLEKEPSHEESRSQNTGEVVPPQRMEHLGKHRQYWRDIILGVNDGLISTYLLVAGVSGSGLSSTDILLTAIAGALAGAVSMSAGEFVATKCQNEVLKGEIGLERRHIRENMAEEMNEVSDLLETIGIPREQQELRNAILSHYETNPEALLKLMAAVEFGFLDEEERSPVLASLTSGLLFFLGSLPSLLPFIPSDQSTMRGLQIATVATITSLLVVGAVKTWATRGNWLSAAMENLLIAGLGGILSYSVGVMFDRLVRQ